LHEISATKPKHETTFGAEENTSETSLLFFSFFEVYDWSAADHIRRRRRKWIRTDVVTRHRFRRRILTRAIMLTYRTPESHPGHTATVAVPQPPPAAATRLLGVQTRLPHQLSSAPGRRRRIGVGSSSGAASSIHNGCGHCSGTGTTTA